MSKMFTNERSYHFQPIDEIIHFKDFIIQFNHQYKLFAQWKLKQLSGYNSVADSVAKSMYRTFVADAKRIRPLFAYMTHRLVGLTYQAEDIVRLGVSLEYFHDFALIHDDISDLSNTRRGEPTIEAEFRDNNIHRGIDVANHIGLNAAIYAGDIALFQSTYLINTLKVDLHTLTTIQDLFYEMQTEVALGQIDDTFGIRHDAWNLITEDRIKNVLCLKSGRYSIQKPMLLGAILAGADEKILQIIEIAGEEFGLVFQIKDDLLGIFGEEKKTGKSTVSDILEGKKTLIMYHTYNRANKEDQELLLETLGNPLASDDKVQRIKQLVIDCGVKKEMEEFCLKGAEKFKQDIRQLPHTDQKMHEVFENLVDYIISRDK